MTLQSSTATMDTLPESVLAAALEFSDCTDLLAAESTSRRLRSNILSQGLWERLARRSVAMSENDESASAMEWKLLVHLATQRSSHSSSLLDNVIGCSSVDRPEESPRNTLTVSPCWLSLHRIPQAIASERVIHRYQTIGVLAQMNCRCHDAKPCYWSSTPSRDRNLTDFIDYTVVPRSLVRLVQVTPYRAFWHPQAPTYGPQAVSFEFYSMHSAAAIASSEKDVLYESPVYPLKNTMEVNEFTLPMPLWLPTGAIMRLNLLGRHQAQTTEAMEWEVVEDETRDYYTCVSHVNAQGVYSEGGLMLPQSPFELEMTSNPSREEDEEDRIPPSRKRRHSA